jgi:RHS repeat-associated protein
LKTITTTISITQPGGVSMRSPSPTRAFTAWLCRLVLLIAMAPALVLAATPTTTALTSSAGTAPVGQSITLTAIVTGASPTGTVTFKDGANTVGSSALTGGVATLSTSALALGSHTLSAEYAGDTNNDPSTSAGVSVAINTGTLTWQYGYDAMGRPTTVLDPNGLATYTYYDSLGRPIQTQQPANTGSATPTTTSFTYNARDDLTKVTDPRSLETTYSPNGLGNVTTQVSPDTGTSQYTYDAVGNVLTKTDARGKLTQYAYDNMNRLTTVTYPTGAPTVIEYDGGPTPMPAATGEITKIIDTSGHTSYSYDSLGRKTSKTSVINGKTFTVTYTWGDSGSALDKLIGITYPSGSKVNYSYDAQGAVSAITVNPANANGVGTNTGTTLPLLSGITQNAASKPTGWTWASSKAQAVSYDSNGQISGYNLGDAAGTGTAAGIRRTVLRDSAGRIVAYTHANNGTPVPSLDQSFAYDNLDRMVGASLGNSAIQYSYDATGNRTAKAIGGTSYPNTIAATSNKLTEIQDVLGTAAIVHDAAGNITSDGVNTYTYSDRGRLATMTNAGGTVTYSYNAREQRVSKTGPTALVPTGAVYYIYDEAGRLLGEYDANGVPVYETIYLSGPVGVMVQTGTAGASNIAVSLYNVSTDQIGAPRIITRSSDEAIVWRWDSAEAFGATAPDQNPNNLGTFTFNLRLPGQVFDAESGLFQNWNREYNPRVGRYMQSDPIGLEGGINTFAYVGGDPLRLADPTGLAVHRGPGNRFGDIPPSSGCQKPIWHSGYIMGWESCDPVPVPVPVSRAEVCTPGNSASSSGGSPPAAGSPSGAGSGTGAGNSGNSGNGDPYDYWRCRSLSTSYFALKQVSFGLIDLFMEDSITSLAGSLSEQFESRARKVPIGVRVAGKALRGGSLAGDYLQFWNSHEMCERATGYW